MRPIIEGYEDHRVVEIGREKASGAIRFEVQARGEQTLGEWLMVASGVVNADCEHRICELYDVEEMTHGTSAA